jgi:hypothetical protein
MSEWGRTTFGEPCAGCGFSWSISGDEADAIVRDAPRLFRDVATQPRDRDRHPDLQWSVSGYVCHVADSIRIWAERIASVVIANQVDVPPYDQDALAKARHYELIDVHAALWSLERSIADWVAAVELTRGRPFVMRHEEVGTMSLTDVAAIRAHDVVHHAWDIERIVDAT